MTDLNQRAAKALTDLRDRVRDVARSLLDDGPHTYVASTSSVLSRAIEQRRSGSEADRMLVLGELRGIASILEVLPRDPWQSFTLDAVRCAAKMLADLTLTAVEKEERCVVVLTEEALSLCGLPNTRTLTTPYGVYVLVREDHGRALLIYRDGGDPNDPILRTRGALSDDQVLERLRCYVAGETAGTRRGAEEIRAGMRLLLNVASADHRHGDA